MKKIFLFIVTGALLLSACDEGRKDTKLIEESEQTKDSELGCISGKITIFNTGNVTDAYVRLSLSENGDVIYSELIAANGDYTIDKIKEGRYFFRVFKAGFVDTLFNETIKIQPKVFNNGNCRQMDWAISKLPPNLYIVEVNSETRINTLDFGNHEDRLYFQIYNNSANTYTWFTDFDEVKLNKGWLTAMSPVSGTLSPNKAAIIMITIDRHKLEPGTNSAKFLIDSNNGGGGVLTITATTP